MADRQALRSSQRRRLGLRAPEHTLRAALTLWRRAVALMGPNCQRPKTARTAPSLIEYDRIVRDLPALAEVALSSVSKRDRNARSQRVCSARTHSNKPQCRYRRSGVSRWIVTFPRKPKTKADPVPRTPCPACRQRGLVSGAGSANAPRLCLLRPADNFAGGGAITRCDKRLRSFRQLQQSGKDHSPRG
jgi:hypothetical protein